MTTEVRERPVTALVSRVRRGLDRREWATLAAMGAVILALNVVGWLVVAAVAGRHLPLGAQTYGVGLGVTAYTLGMRHAFDADHIAAIDNTTRALMHRGKRPLSVGFWFSLGHSSVVFALAFLLALGVKSLVGPVRNGSSTLHHYTGLVGTGVSGAFLLLIGAINVVILVGILKVFRALRRGVYDEQGLERHLADRGLLNRILRPVTRSVRRPAQMYPVGVLFGLGFDTATEVALLVLAAAGAAGTLPWYAILALPVLFAAGMCLFDTIDGTFMNFAYGWAFSRPVRKVFYNITVTGLSVVVAVAIGGVELLGLLAQQLRLSGTFWTGVQDVDVNTLGFVVAGLFVVTWVVALAVWRLGRVEERWSAGLRPTGDVPGAD